MVGLLLLSCHHRLLVSVLLLLRVEWISHRHRLERSTLLLDLLRGYLLLSCERILARKTEGVSSQLRLLVGHKRWLLCVEAIQNLRRVTTGRGEWLVSSCKNIVYVGLCGCLSRGGRLTKNIHEVLHSARIRFRSSVTISKEHVCSLSLRLVCWTPVLKSLKSKPVFCG